MSRRLWIGYTGNTPRIKLSKPFKDAPTEERPKHLQFDSAWDQGMTIHWQGIVSKGTKKVPFDKLSYIPFVLVSTVNNKGDTHKVGKSFDLDGFSISNDEVKLPDRNNPAMVAVFRAKSFDSAFNPGYNGGRCPRMLIGNPGRPGWSYGIYISRPKYDVRLCNEGDLIFSSDRRIANILAAGQINCKGNDWSGGNYQQIPFNTMVRWPGYIPLATMSVSEAGKNAIYTPNSRAMDGNDNLENALITGSIDILNQDGFIILHPRLENSGGKNPGKNVFVRYTMFDVGV